jgi:hypothetical protein
VTMSMTEEFITGMGGSVQLLRYLDGPEYVQLCEISGAVDARGEAYELRHQVWQIA